MEKLTRATFRLAYRTYIGNDLLNATADHDQYLRTGEVPYYVQRYMGQVRSNVNGVFHLPTRDY